MKKFLSVLVLFLIVLFVGCEKVEECPVEEKGNYKEGTYLGSVVDNYGGSSNTAFAVIYVDDNGMLKSVYADTTYTKDDIFTTKKVLGDDYGMTVNPNASGEWDEQIKKLENAIIANQGLDFITFTDETNEYTDTVSGVTIKIDAIYKAIENALSQAK